MRVYKIELFTRVNFQTPNIVASKLTKAYTPPSIMYFVIPVQPVYGKPLSTLLHLLLDRFRLAAKTRVRAIRIRVDPHQSRQARILGNCAIVL